MEIRNSQNWLTHIAIALFAGFFASVTTLIASGQLPLGGSTSPVSDTQLSSAEEPADAAVGDPVNSSASSKHPDDNHAELQSALDDALAERSQLAQSLVSVTRQLEALDAELSDLAEFNDQQLLSSELAEATPIDALAGIELNGESGGFGGFGRPASAEQQLQNLQAAGLDEQSARDLQGRRDQYQLARLELFDQAAREGWSDSDQLTERLQQLEEDRVDLRSELGDAAYDRYLFESGRPNRVTISSVISGSAAELAGLQVGDVVESYASEYIYGATEIQQATRSGTRGEFVQIVFNRGGQDLSAELPRGPLGVTLGTTRVEP